MRHPRHPPPDTAMWSLIGWWKTAASIEDDDCDQSMTMLRSPVAQTGRTYRPSARPKAALRRVIGGSSELHVGGVYYPLLQPGRVQRRKSTTSGHPVDAFRYRPMTV
jgi:hypothetical protein